MPGYVLPAVRRQLAEALTAAEESIDIYDQSVDS